MYSKNSRILEALRQINAGELLVHPEVRSKVVFQASHWNPLKRDNIDNILDLLAYAQKIMNLYGHLMSIEGKVLLEESKTARVIETIPHSKRESFLWLRRYSISSFKRNK